MSRSRTTNTSTGVRVLQLLLGVALWGPAIACAPAPPPGGSDSATQASVSDIPFEVVDRWEIANGGSVRVVVIAPINRNEADLRQLGEQLRTEAASDRNAGAEIYDDKRAASLRKEALTDKLSKKDMAFHDSHKIGEYTKNGNTSYHRLVLMLGGIDSAFTNVDYR